MMHFAMMKQAPATPLISKSGDSFEVEKNNLCDYDNIQLERFFESIESDQQGHVPVEDFWRGPAECNQSAHREEKNISEYGMGIHSLMTQCDAGSLCTSSNSYADPVSISKTYSHAGSISNTEPVQKLKEAFLEPRSGSSAQSKKRKVHKISHTTVTSKHSPVCPDRTIFNKRVKHLPVIRTGVTFSCANKNTRNGQSDLSSPLEPCGIIPKLGDLSTSIGTKSDMDICGITSQESSKDHHMPISPHGRQNSEVFQENIQRANTMINTQLPLNSAIGFQTEGSPHSSIFTLPALPPRSPDGYVYPEVPSTRCGGSPFPYSIFNNEPLPKSDQIEPLVALASILFAEKMVKTLRERLEGSNSHIWTAQTVLPFVFSQISRNPSAGGWQRLSTMTLYILESYNENYIASRDNFHEDLAMFLQWHTIMSYQLSHPGIKFGESYSTVITGFNERDIRGHLSAVGRFFYGIQDQQRYISSFRRQRNHLRCTWSKAYLSQMWKNNLKHFGPLKASYSSTGSLWDKWGLWSNQIYSNAMTKNEVGEEFLLNSQSLDEPLFREKKHVMDELKQHSLYEYWEGKMSSLWDFLKRNTIEQVSSSIDVCRLSIQLSYFISRSSSEKVKSWGTRFDSNLIQDLIDDLEVERLRDTSCVTQGIGWLSLNHS